jgi:methionyl-tRNA formyltransferase
MRLLFLGTPEFAVPTLEALVAARHEIAAVVTQPDRPKGRGKEVAAPPVKEAAVRLRLPVHQPERIRTPESLQWFTSQNADALIVVGYGKIIPQSIIDLPRRGILNVHASLLPKYRGAAPIQWAIASGETRTGVTIMQIDAGLDTGDILAQSETNVGPDETAIDLSPRLAALGAALLVDTLPGIERGTIVRRQQDDARATVAPVLKKEDGKVDWNCGAQTIHNRARGFLPWPGCYTQFRGRLLQIWKTRRANDRGEAPPGRMQVDRNRLFAACGEGGWLEILELQVEGRKRISAANFLNGQHIGENELFGDS